MSVRWEELKQVVFLMSIYESGGNGWDGGLWVSTDLALVVCIVVYWFFLWLSDLFYLLFWGEGLLLVFIKVGTQLRVEDVGDLVSERRSQVYFLIYCFFLVLRICIGFSFFGRYYYRVQGENWGVGGLMEVF